MKKMYVLTGVILLTLCGWFFFSYANGVEKPEMDVMASSALTEPIKPQGKILVAYFTLPEDGNDASSGASRLVSDGIQYGSTEYIATLISQKTGGDLFAIKTEQTYPGTHRELVDMAKKEMENNARPKLSTHIQNLDDYDVVFVGFPNWWYDMPMPIYSFFDEYDFTGKTIIPFCTHGGSRFSQAEKTIAELEKGAKMQKGIAISRSNASQSKELVWTCLKQMGL